MSAHTGTIDFEGIARAALSQSKALLESWLPAGKWAGREFLIGDIHGTPGESLSINSTTGAWADFSGDVRGGDLVSLYAAINRLSQVDAARQLSASLGRPVEPRSGIVVPLKRADKAKDWAPIVPVPEDAPAAPVAHYKLGEPSHIARYLNREGALVGLIYRFDLADGEKEFRPLTYCQNAAGRNEWQWQAFPAPRSLYGAELLRSSGRVLVVEGEKKAEAARRMLGDVMVVVAWPGGARAIVQADWSLLAGRDCVIWPDNDPAGRDAAAAIVIQLRHHGATARVVDVPGDAPPKWDLADAEKSGWDGERVLSLIEPRPMEPEAPEFEHFDAEPDAGCRDFIALGHDHGRFFFFSSGGGQVRDFSARDLQTVGSLCELAPLRYFEMNHPGKGDAGFNVRGAGDTLVRACYRAGVYDVDRIRGRGAWIDKDRSVLHMGDRLLVNGQEHQLTLPESWHIYEAAKPLTAAAADPLSTAEANKLVGICNAPNWQHGISGILLAGFIVVAPICGGLAWRPSIWITGGAGSGKSYLKDNILAPAMGGMALLVQSKTTEAGIRQTLNCDARPVLFDEAEREDASAATRMQGVLDLLRQSSSEGGAEIVKGSQSQTGAKRYRIRSCFALSSINVGIEHQADESRITILALRDRDASQAAESEAKFADLNRTVQATITPAFAAGLLSRSVRLLPTIRANAETFARAVSVVFGSRRTGDQLGALLAGAYALHSDRTITDEAAEKWVREKDWGTAAGCEVERDEVRLLSHLTQHRIRFSQGNGGSNQEATIGRLLLARAGEDQQINADVADLELKQIGIRYDVRDRKYGIYVSTNHPALKRILIGTPWSAGWARALGRLPGAVTGDQKNVRFAFGHVGKACWVPMAAIDRPEDGG